MLRTRRTVGWAITGGAVGVVLWLLAFFCAGAGHGTLIPLVVSTSPLTLVPFVGFLLGAPVLWGSLAVLATAPRTRRNTIWFLGVMLSHYLVAAGFVCWAPGCNWDLVVKTQEAIPGFFEGWLMSYCVANFLAWWLFLGASRPAGRDSLHPRDCAEITRRQA